MHKNSELQNEVWVAVCAPGWGVFGRLAPAEQPVFIYGFHPKTKAMLHIYGPFTSGAEMDVFQAEHKITLSYPTWERV